MLKPRLPSLPCLLLALAAFCLSAVGVRAQSDLPVTTERVKPAPGGPALPPDALKGIKLSDQPRYYLDTIDNLNRNTNDQTRRAPGLAKNNYIGKVYPVHNTQAIEIQSYLLRMLAYEGGTAEVMGAPGVKDDDGKPVQYVFVTAPDFMIPGIDKIVKTCDRKGFKYFDATGLDFGGGPGAVRYVGKNRTASELKAILAGTELGNVGNFLYPPFADDSTNSIYIAENPSDIADDLSALNYFDKPPLQLELDVTIYEIQDDNLSKLGLDWDAWKRHFSGSLDYESTANSFDEVFSPGASNQLWTTALSLDARVLTEFLNYTVQTGTSRIVTETKVTMVNSEDNPGELSGGARGKVTGQPAVISSKSVYPLPALKVEDDEDGGKTVQPDPVWEGVEVKVLPFIATQSITLQIDATVHSLVGFTKDRDLPIVSSRTLNSVVNLQDGKPIVLGGLEKNSVVNSRVGIPGLKDIPVLKYLFSKEIANHRKSKVLISLKPRLKESDTKEAAKL